MTIILMVMCHCYVLTDILVVSDCVVILAYQRTNLTRFRIHLNVCLILHTVHIFTNKSSVCIIIQ